MFIIVSGGHHRLVLPDSHGPIFLSTFSMVVEHRSYRPRFFCGPSDVATENSEQHLIMPIRVHPAESTRKETTYVTLFTRRFCGVTSLVDSPEAAEVVGHCREDVESTIPTRKRARGLSPTATTSHFNILFMGDGELLAHARRRWRPIGALRFVL